MRAVFTLMTIAAALVLGESRQTSSGRNRPTGWLAASLFLIMTAIPGPKLLAVTADG